MLRIVHASIDKNYFGKNIKPYPTLLQSIDTVPSDSFGLKLYIQCAQFILLTLMYLLWQVNPPKIGSVFCLTPFQVFSGVWFTGVWFLRKPAISGLVFSGVCFFIFGVWLLQRYDIGVPAFPRVRIRVWWIEEANTKWISWINFFLMYAKFDRRRS